MDYYERKARQREEMLRPLAWCWVACFIIIVLALFGVGRAEAVTISWVNPTEYEDGTVLELMEFQRFDLSCSATPGDRSVITATWIDTVPTRTVQNGLFPRGVPVHCALRVAAIHPVKTGGTTALSDWSNEVNFSLPLATPLPPTGLTVDAID